jgi:hypothetical protein
MWLVLIFTLITTALTLAFALPRESRAMLAELKRQLRLWVIRYSGEQAAKVLAQDFYQAAVRKGHDPKMVKQVLDENWEIICDRLGTPVANDILGEPSPLERYG